MIRRRMLRGTAVLALATAIGATVIGATGCGHSGTGGGSAQRPASAGHSLVPASGAYLGAYVQPTSYTQAGQISAVQSFERRLGHPLQIVHVYHPWGKPFPTAADSYFVNHGKILLLTWGGAPDTQAIVAGKDDAMIRARARAVKALGHPIMMEFRHEMDRPNLQWTIHGPTEYIAAWDHIRAVFSSVGATNVSWVWCPTGLGFASGRAQPFYPGDNEVDWICADVYATSTSQSLRAASAPFLRWASHHDKPVIIGEFGVIGNPPGWAAWLTAAGRLPETDHQIKAMAYFDANGVNSSGDAYQFWLGDRPAAMSAFASLLRQPYFRPAVPSDP
jgi:hypothetical protein